MATRESGARESSRLAGALVRFVLVGSFTGVETIALVGWLAFVADASVVSQATAVGLGILLVGLVVEHFLTDQAVNGVDLAFPVGKGVFFSVTETALWAAWLLIADLVGGVEGLAVAGVVLAVLLVPQHTIEDNALRGRGLFASLVNRHTVGFSVVEAAGASVWLLFVRHDDLIDPLLRDVGLQGVDTALLGVGMLAIALFVEHNVGVAFSRRD